MWGSWVNRFLFYTGGPFCFLEPSSDGLYLYESKLRELVERMPALSKESGQTYGDFFQFQDSVVFGFYFSCSIFMLTEDG